MVVKCGCKHYGGYMQHDDKNFAAKYIKGSAHLGFKKEHVICSWTNNTPTSTTRGLHSTKTIGGRCIIYNNTYKAKFCNFCTKGHQRAPRMDIKHQEGNKTEQQASKRHKE